ncbi:histidinol-phosphate aminotransferase [Chloropicon primus]|uniref:histidinol-phosphate transaminase n=1 Tax=Chloropicon primus TaxID=1764295 RepID=A0A5B8MSX1_9CHLO|nr:histidinol-phosphate aminotransferase [Chloropicon primus]UPR02599.1 histidinol-phosphate aminotransferase [Chloropicon primus]|eukprot:QDZ23387.1 histidinol-phosphate aminotransferase [Chloropicon primus]
MKATDFLRTHLKTLAPYTPIEPFEVLSQKLGRAPGDIVKLDANENPYGPPPEVLDALGTMKFPNIYPDPECRRLRGLLADYVGVPAENILVGCGADELIDLLMRCVLEPGDTIVDTPPTFTMYAFDADVNAAKTVQVPRLDGFKIDVDGVSEAVREHGAKILFVTSPNNPDGGVISDKDLRRLLDLPCLVVLDEAYIEFAKEDSRSSWVLERENMVVFRTFSKSAGLAGLRVGYGIFPTDLITYLWRAKQPYNVSAAAELAACTALENVDYMNTVRDMLVQERGVLMRELDSIWFLEPFRSQSNFILCKVTGGTEAHELKQKLQNEYGVMVRHYNKALLNGYIRISVGKPEQHVVLMAALRDIADKL